MTSLLILAVVLLLVWGWCTWQRDGAASFAGSWCYSLLVAAIICIIMSIGLWIR